MDPTEPSSWPIWIKLLCGWGPLGVWAVRAELARARAEREHHKTRDAYDKRISEMEDRHGKSITAVTDRMVKVVENQSRVAHRLADGVTSRIRRRRKDEHDEEGGSEEGGGDGGADS